MIRIKEIGEDSTVSTVDLSELIDAIQNMTDGQMLSIWKADKLKETINRLKNEAGL